jgi:hypothetical protein
VPEASDYIWRVRMNGALLVADPRALAACITVLSGNGNEQ